MGRPRGARHQIRKNNNITFQFKEYYIKKNYCQILELRPPKNALPRLENTVETEVCSWENHRNQ